MYFICLITNVNKLLNACIDNYIEGGGVISKFKDIIALYDYEIYEIKYGAEVIRNTWLYIMNN